MDAKLKEAIEGIHASPTKAVIAATGGGAQALAWLLVVPNASRTVLEITVPYADAALTELLGRAPAQVVSEEVAMDMAQLAYERAEHLSGDPSSTGIGATATIRTQREKRGEHRCFVAVCSSEGRRGYGVTMVKGMRERQAEDEIVSRLIVGLLAEESGVDFDVPLGLSDMERLEVLEEPGRDPVRHLLEGSALPRTGGQGRVRFRGAALPQGAASRLVLSPAWRPRGAGKGRLGDPRYGGGLRAVDRKRGQASSHIRGGEPPTAPVRGASQGRSHKGGDVRGEGESPARHYLRHRVRYGDETVRSQVLRREPTAMDEALAELQGSGCRFLVAGRVEDDRFRSLDDVGVPAGFKDMLAGIPESAFRRDVSSTEIRGAVSRL